MQLEVDTQNGTVRGEASDGPGSGVRVFRGIPFAQPPVGSLRFMPPAPLKAWTGVRDATAFGPVAMQTPTVLEGDHHLPADMSEDCLTLNIWAPGADDAAGDGLPVLVWIHGGAFVTGSGAIPWYDGANLAARGDVVVVTINYRLGVFGYLTLAEVGGEAYASSGNAAVLDQIAALSWVKDNIASFGGDPDRVCVVGESAGAMSIGTLLSTSSADGLFSRAIMQSGAPTARTTEQAANCTADLFVELGLEADAGGLEQLMGMPAGEILTAATAMTTRRMADGNADEGGFPWSPVVDGAILTEHPMLTSGASGASAVPLMIGTNADEMRILRRLFADRPEIDGPQLELQLAAMGPLALDIIKGYGEIHPSFTPEDIWDAIAGDQTFGLPCLSVIDSRVQTGAPTWTYRFNWSSASEGGRYGAVHTVEIPFVFNTFDQPGVADFLARPASDYAALCARVQDAWVSFARDGRPSAADLPAWPACGVGSLPTMTFDLKCELVEDPLEPVRTLWATVFAPS
jgi:para-nitrobenzyl esterase